MDQRSSFAARTNDWETPLTALSWSLCTLSRSLKAGLDVLFVLIMHLPGKVCSYVFVVLRRIQSLPHKISKYRLYHLKCNPTTITYCGTKMKLEAGPPRVILSPNLPRDNWVKVSVVTRPLLAPFAQICTGMNVVYLVPMSPPQASILNQMNPIDAIQPCLRIVHVFAHMFGRVFIQSIWRFVAFYVAIVKRPGFESQLSYLE